MECLNREKAGEEGVSGSAGVSGKQEHLLLGVNHS